MVKGLVLSQSGLEVRPSKILWVRTIYLDGKLVAPYPKWDGYFLILDSY
jgi:hypothetical protein